MRESVSIAQDDAAARLWWGIRRLLLPLAVLVVAGAVAGAVASRVDRGPRYEASALVVAKTVPAHSDARILSEQLPRLGQAIFSGGTVAQRAALDLPFTPDELIPDHATLEPLEGTIGLRVNGLAGERPLAVLVANDVAAAFVTQLNKAGPGLGRFALEDQARISDVREKKNALVLFVVIGALGGLLLGLGLVAAFVLLRRPVLTGGDAEEASGVPVLAAPRLSASRRGSDAVEVPGLAALVGRVYGDNRRSCAFVSPWRARRSRTQLASLVAQVLARSGDVVLVRSEDGGDAALQAARHGIQVTGDVEGAYGPTSAAVVVDGPSVDRIDVSQVVPADVHCVLVVEEGVKRAVVQDAASQFAGDDLLGIVLVRRRRRFRRSAAPEPARREVHGVSPSPEWPTERVECLGAGSERSDSF